MNEAHIERALHLLRVGRSEDAAEELERVLSQDPSNAAAHAYRALALVDLDAFTEALESAERAMGEAPEWSFPHYVQGSVHLTTGRFKAALRSAEEAIALDPSDEQNHALAASAYVGLSRWNDALDAADEGLRIDPEDERCLNLRALSLRMLGATEDAEFALETALANDPENAWTLENLAWTRLQEGDAAEAARLFREALRLDPGDPSARAGLAAAIKAKSPLFRPILAWQLFCAKLSDGKGGLLILGFWVLNQAVQRSPLGGTAAGTVLLVAYLTFVWMSWAGNALFDVALLARRDLRPILEPRERVAAAGVGLLVVLALVALVEAFTLGRGNGLALPLRHLFTHSAGALAAAAIPMAGWSPLPNGKARAVGLALAVVATAGALGALVLSHVWYVDALDLPERFVPGGPLQGRVDAAKALFARVPDLVLFTVVVSVASSWLLTALGFVPEGRGSRGQRRRPGR